MLGDERLELADELGVPARAARSASIRSSRHARRSSSSRAISACAKRSNAKSASGGPRQSDERLVRACPPAGEPLEAVEVELAVCDRQQVPGRPRLARRSLPSSLRSCET